MILVPPSSRFFFNGGPKKALSLSLDVKFDQWTHKKMMPPIMASISRKSSNKVPILIFQMLLAGWLTHDNRAFFMGLKGFLWVWLWEVKILWVRIMGVTLVINVDSTSRNACRTSLSHLLSSMRSWCKFVLLCTCNRICYAVKVRSGRPRSCASVSWHRMPAFATHNS